MLTPQTQEAVYTVQEAATLLHVHKRTIIRMIKRKQIKAFNLNENSSPQAARYRIVKHDLDRLLREGM